MFTIVVPPDYAEELQQICTLDASQREKLISLLALAWLDWKQQHLSALEVAEDIVRIVREQEIFPPRTSPAMGRAHGRDVS